MPQLLVRSPKSRFRPTAIALARRRRHSALTRPVDDFQSRAAAMLQHGFHVSVIDKVVPAAAQVSLADGVEVEAHGT